MAAGAHRVGAAQYDADMEQDIPAHDTGDGIHVTTDVITDVTVDVTTGVTVDAPEAEELLIEEISIDGMCGVY